MLLQITLEPAGIAVQSSAPSPNTSLAGAESQMLSQGASWMSHVNPHLRAEVIQMGGKSKKNSLRESQQSGASALLAKNGAAPCGPAAEADGKSPGS